MQEERQRLVMGVIVTILFVFLALVILLAIPEPSKETNYYVQSNNVNSIIASNVNVGDIQEKIVRVEPKPKKHPIIYAREPVVTTKTKQCSYVKTPYTIQEKQLVADEPCGVGMKYSSSKTYESSKGFFGNEIGEYTVQVRNNDCSAGYFTVVFYFSDDCGDERKVSVKHYIDPNEVKSFSYRDMKDEFTSWRYSVVPGTKSVKQEIKLRTVTKYRYDWVCS